MWNAKRLSAFAILAVIVCLCPACVSVPHSDRILLKEARAKGLEEVPNEAKVKDPVVAGALNILPGFGNFYLGGGTRHKDQMAWGVVNLLLWPLSVVWGVPKAAIDAGNINKISAAEYYRTGDGAAKLR